jgi:hypothetical protein
MIYQLSLNALFMYLKNLVMSCFYFVTILSAIIYSEIMMFSISNFSIILQISCENFIDRNVIRDCNLNMYCVFCNMSIVCYLRNFHLGQFFIFSYPKKNHSILHVSLLYHLKKNCKSYVLDIFSVYIGFFFLEFSFSSYKCIFFLEDVFGYKPIFF